MTASPSPWSFLAVGVGLTRRWAGVDGEGDPGAGPHHGASEPEAEGSGDIGSVRDLCTRVSSPEGGTEGGNVMVWAAKPPY